MKKKCMIVAGILLLTIVAGIYLISEKKHDAKRDESSEVSLATMEILIEEKLEEMQDAQPKSIVVDGENYMQYDMPRSAPDENEEHNATLNVLPFEPDLARIIGENDLQAFLEERLLLDDNAEFDVVVEEYDIKTRTNYCQITVLIGEQRYYITYIYDTREFKML